MPRDEAEKNKKEIESTTKMAFIMKKMHSPRNFVSPLLKHNASPNLASV
jgi:hypothetical protein